MEYTLSSARAGMSPAEFERYAAELEAQSAIFNNSLFQSVLMFLTVFVIGFVISMVSAALLRRRRPAAEEDSARTE